MTARTCRREQDGVGHQHDEQHDDQRRHVGVDVRAGLVPGAHPGQGRERQAVKARERAVAGPEREAEANSFDGDGTYIVG